MSEAEKLFAKPEDRTEPVEITLQITRGVERHLQRLLESGLYGRTTGEAAERIITQWIIERNERGQR